LGRVRITCRYHRIPTGQDDGIVSWENDAVLTNKPKLPRMLEAEFEAKIELLSGRGSILIKASNQDRRGSFGYIIVVNEDVTRERTVWHH
jgi:hypothetical protein